MLQKFGCIYVIDSILMVGIGSWKMPKYCKSCFGGQLKTASTGIYYNDLQRRYNKVCYFITKLLDSRFPLKSANVGRLLDKYKRKVIIFCQSVRDFCDIFVISSWLCFHK